MSSNGVIPRNPVQQILDRMLYVPEIKDKAWRGYLAANSRDEFAKALREAGIPDSAHGAVLDAAKLPEPLTDEEISKMVESRQAGDSYAPGPRLKDILDRRAGLSPDEYVEYGTGRSIDPDLLFKIQNLDELVRERYNTLKNDYKAQKPMLMSDELREGLRVGYGDAYGKALNILRKQEEAKIEKEFSAWLQDPKTSADDVTKALGEISFIERQKQKKNKGRNLMTQIFTDLVTTLYPPAGKAYKVGSYMVSPTPAEQLKTRSLERMDTAKVDFSKREKNQQKR